MGQVNLALAARDHLNDGGSITLISGITGDAPIPAGSSGQHGRRRESSGFVMAAAVGVAARHPHQSR